MLIYLISDKLLATPAKMWADPSPALILSSKISQSWKNVPKFEECFFSTAAKILLHLIFAKKIYNFSVKF